MFRAVVRRLISPLVRWAAVGGKCVLLQGRDEDGMVFVLVLDCFGNDLELLMTPAEAREWTKGLLKLARDALEGVPLVDDPNLPPL